jgi:biopolymer transport protein ExbD
MTDSQDPKGDATAEKPRPARASQAKFKASVRRTIRLKAHTPDVNFLNITAMLDIMTIILVFLLKNLGESSASIPQSDDLKIPRSILTAEPTQEGVRVTISRSQLIVGDTPVLDLPARQSQVQSGAGAKNKRGGPNDLFIVPLGNALGEARKTDKAIRTAKGLDATMSEAVIIADQSTPWRLFIEVLFTLGQSEFGRYHLMVLQSKSAN